MVRWVAICGFIVLVSMNKYVQLQLEVDIEYKAELGTVQY